MLKCVSCCWDLRISKEKEEEIKSRFSSSLRSSSKIGLLKSCYKNSIEPYYGGFNLISIDDNWTFKQLLEFLHKQDIGSFQSISKVDISIFDRLLISLDKVNYQLYSLDFFAKKEPDNHAESYFRYLRSRQNFLIDYHRSALNYIHEHDEEYLEPVL